MPNGVKTRFAGLLRELLRRFDENETGADLPQSPRPVASGAPPTPPTPVPRVATPQPKAVAPAAGPKRPPAENATEVELALPGVLEGLPPQLHARLTLTGADLNRATISIAAGKILPQLAQGAVKITFGELRQAAPTLFNVDEEYDSLPVALPLNEILARLSPNALVRNPEQKTVAVPENITGPFTNRGEGVSICTTPLKPSPAAAPPIRMATPPARATAKAPSPPVAPPPPAFVSRSIAPERPASPSPSQNNGPGQSNGNGNGAPTPPIIPNFSLPTLPTAPATPKPMPPAVPKPMPSPTAPKPMPLPAATTEATISVSLAALSENWPAPLRLEIAQLISANTLVALPVSLVEPALKRGRVTFPWRNLRSWIQPHPPAVSIHDNLELELPLKVIAPLFLSRLSDAGKTARPRSSTTPPTEIPNLFFGFPQPQSPSEVLQPPAKLPLPDSLRNAPRPAEVRRPAEVQRLDTNFYTWVESDTTLSVARPSETEFKSQGTTPATDFSSRRVPPDEIVSHALKLPGVAGALVALPDGLMVANQIPAELNADTLAAFLPQIYGRVSQCTKELRMGELNNLNFTVGNVPWKIFRIHGVYFAAFGRAGEPLPTAQLAQLAAELDRKKP